jgi:uncharacterized protein YjbI with pentapeptide repeats
MSGQDGRQATALQRPSTGDAQAWQAYWKSQGQPWRTEPEIDRKRQNELAQRRSIDPDIAKGIYPFKDIKLSRADVEWLLATHENGRGPVDWSDKSQREREGLDLRGANLCHVNLSNLPLARIRGWLTLNEWNEVIEERSYMAAVLIKDANLYNAHLEGANLIAAHLEGAYLWGAHLEGAILRGAHLEGANLREAYLEGVNLRWAYLERADLRGTHLVGAQLRGIWLGGALLENVILSDEKHRGPQLVDIHWGDVNLAVVKWSQVEMLGDEHEARQKRHDGKVKYRATRLKEYEEAVRANRQLAVALQNQGLNEKAASFAYRAQVLQKSVLWFQMTQQGAPFRQRMQALGAWLFSWFLFLLAGYGYRPGRSVLWYLATIVVFALVYHVFGHLSLWPPDSFVYSLTSFHGRGFFPGLEGKHSLHDPLIMLAAVEAVVGLFIEISFIATFTQRFFGK